MTSVYRVRPLNCVLISSCARYETSGVLVAVFSGHKTSETESSNEMVNKNILHLLYIHVCMYLSINVA